MYPVRGGRGCPAGEAREADATAGDRCGARRPTRGHAVGIFGMNVPVRGQGDEFAFLGILVMMALLLVGLVAYFPAARLAVGGARPTVQPPGRGGEGGPDVAPARSQRSRSNCANAQASLPQAHERGGRRRARSTSRGIRWLWATTRAGGATRSPVRRRALAPPAAAGGAGANSCWWARPCWRSVTARPRGQPQRLASRQAGRSRSAGPM